MVDVVVMPPIIAVATTHSRKAKPAHEGRGSSLLPLPSQPQQQAQVHFLAATKRCQHQHPHDGRAGMRGQLQKGGGGDGKQINVVVTVSRGSIQAAMGNAEPPTYHHGLLPLDPFCVFTTF
jgi:hypothetical protein